MFSNTQAVAALLARESSAATVGVRRPSKRPSNFESGWRLLSGFVDDLERALKRVALSVALQNTLDRCRIGNSGNERPRYSSFEKETHISMPSRCRPRRVRRARPRPRPTPPRSPRCAAPCAPPPPATPNSWRVRRRSIGSRVASSLRGGCLDHDGRTRERANALSLVWDFISQNSWTIPCESYGSRAQRLERRSTLELALSRERGACVDTRSFRTSGVLECGRVGFGFVFLDAIERGT